MIMLVKEVPQSRESSLSPDLMGDRNALEIGFLLISRTDPLALREKPCSKSKSEKTWG